MSRTTMSMVAGLLVVGCVVALLPAQESSRRTASKYRLATPGAPGTERPSLAPVNPADGDLPPVANSHASSSSSAGGAANTRSPYSPIGQQLTREYVEQSPAATGDNAVASEPAAAADAAALNDIDESHLHSVLKRAKVPAMFEPAAPPAAPSQMQAESSAGSGDLPRRGIPALPPTTAPAAPARSVNASAAAARPGQNVSAVGKSAALKVEIAGPQGVTVGKPAAYVVSLSNESETVADEVQVRIALPSWVTVQATQPTVGEAAMQGDPQGNVRLVWNLPKLGGRSRETLKLQLVTREGDAFDLGVEWTCKPSTTRAAIAVKQPQLDLSLAGPAEMTFGEEKTFTLSVSNPGTGDAERVIVSVAAGNSPPQQFDAGTIPAGHKKEVPLAVVASQAGAIELQITAAAESGLEARTSGKINVRKAEVSLAIQGPPLKYAGTEAAYMVTVANSGTAAADNINLSLALPAGAKYLGGIDGASAAAAGLKWKINSLAAGAERVYEVRLQLSAAGLNRIVVQSQATASGTANSAVETEVEAISDLKLVVNDPSGPVATDEPATYEMQVLNRGSQAAKQVKIIVQFSDGVEPVSFEGCEARLVPGQVLCQPLAQLGPGEQVTLRVKAKAAQAGTHHFRVEVTTTDGDARLVSEGTTRFFSEAGRGGAAASTARKPSLVPTPSIPTTLR
jgi:hypothetical protein